MTSLRLSPGMFIILWILPSTILTTRFAKALSTTSWVTIIIVIPSLMFRSTKIFITMSVDRVSRSPVGSSRSKILGLFAIERAIVTLYCSPPESWLGKWSMRVSSPTSARSFTALCLISSLESFPYSCMGSSTFSKAERLPMRLKV